MSERPKWVNTEVRAARRNRRIPDGAACALCGETNRLLLLRASAERVKVVLLEFHHTAGAANDAVAGGWLCANHHRIATELQRHAGATLVHDGSRHQLERIEAMLRSTAAFLGQIVEALVRAADYLAAFIRAADRDLPTWRILPVTPT